MTPCSQRRAFTALISILATAFVIGIWRQRFSWQADYLADLIKISVLIALSTAVVSFIMWSLTHRSKDTALRGALAGALTALVIIPLPAMAWAFKTEFLMIYQFGVLGAVLEATSVAMKAGLVTFVNMTKASLIATLGSMCVGAGVAHLIPGRAEMPA